MAFHKIKFGESLINEPASKAKYVYADTINDKLTMQFRARSHTNTSYDTLEPLLSPVPVHQSNSCPFTYSATDYPHPIITLNFFSVQAYYLMIAH